MENLGINILILGKTGVGKSAFCNYIFGEELFKTGIGKPVTQWGDHLRCQHIKHEGFNLNLFDSVGIETNNLNDWRSHLDKFLKERNSIESNPGQWPHGIFYLVNAASARIEPTEINLINDLTQQNITISIILTNADSATSQNIDNLIKAIKEGISTNKIDIHKVCSVGIRKRGGLSDPFGKEEVLNNFLANLDASLCKKILLHLIFFLRDNYDIVRNEIRNKIKELDLNCIKLVKGALRDDLDDIINSDFDSDFMDNLSDKYDDHLNEFDNFLENLKYKGNIKTSENVTSLLNDFEDVWQNDEEFQNYMDSISNGLESDSTQEQIFSVFKIAVITLRPETKMLELVDKRFAPIKKFLDSVEHQVKETGKYSI